MTTVCRSIWISSALAIVGMTLLFASQPATVPHPGAMKLFTASDRSVRIEHPGNWKARVRSSHAVETEVEFRPARTAFMTINVNLQGSLMVDMLKATESQNNRIAGIVPGGEALNPRQASPIVFLHSTQAAQLKNQVTEYPGFADGEATKGQIAGREALISTCGWTTPGLIGNRRMVGRRVTLLSGEHQVSVVYGCSEDMQQAILPVFDRMLTSLEVDIQGGGR